MAISKQEQLRSKEDLIKDLEQENFSRVTVSFYKYVQISDVQKMREDLFDALYKFDCKGRIYIAPEGINAQMNVPEHNWNAFDAHIQSISEFKGTPYKIGVEQDNKSFIRLTVKVKSKIVADGLDDKSFDPANTGEYLSASEVNEHISNPDSIIIDMRNEYEAEVGHFDTAKIMPVDTFKEQLDTVEKDFSEDKDKDILLYCTGGIRCEKASAWMKHQGFKNVKHIKGGIIDYAHQVKEQGLENKFRGKNFVFDERLGERISDEIIATCHLCKTTKADNHYHCKNLSCHTLFIGCDECLEQRNGYCSKKCIWFDKLPIKTKKWIMKNSFKKKHGVYKKKRMTLNV